MSAPAQRAIWSSAFPLATSSDAVEAVCDSWAVLASRPRPHFNNKKREEHLTRVIKAHAERVTGPKRGLIGMWAAENVINRVDFESGTVLEERRTDIVYGWNDEQAGYQLVMEFKKLNSKAASRKHYLGTQGIGRFVSGMYSYGQPIALMIGLLTDPADQVISKLQSDLVAETNIQALCLLGKEDGAYFEQPSALFVKAMFDTDHSRPEPAGPPSGVIRVAHLFLSFCS